MTWKSTDHWPTKRAEPGFRHEAFEVEREIECRTLSTYQRLIAQQQRPLLVKRFSLTRRELYAELEDGTRLVIDRSHLTTVELHAPVAGIGRGDSLVFFPFGRRGAPQNIEDEGVLLSLVPPILTPLPNSGPRRAPAVTLAFLFVMTVLRVMAMFQSAYVEPYALVFLLLPIVLMRTIRQRAFVDSRGQVTQTGDLFRRTRVRSTGKPMSALPRPETLGATRSVFRLILTLAACCFLTVHLFWLVGIVLSIDFTRGAAFVNVFILCEFGACIAAVALWLSLEHASAPKRFWPAPTDDR